MATGVIRNYETLHWFHVEEIASSQPRYSDENDASALAVMKVIGEPGSMGMPGERRRGMDSCSLPGIDHGGE